MNRCIIIGHLGRDAETKFTQNGKAVSNFSVATSRKFKKGDAWEKETEWHNCVVWDKEKLAGYLLKGQQVAIEGRLKTDSYEKDGVKMYRTQIIVENLEFVGGKSGSDGDSDAQQPSQARGNNGEQQNRGGFNRGAGQGSSKAPAPAAPDNYDGMQITDDDIPF